MRPMTILIMILLELLCGNQVMSDIHWIRCVDVLLKLKYSFIKNQKAYSMFMMLKPQRRYD